jgi:hypothetical protein
MEERTMIKKPRVGMRVVVTGSRYCADCSTGDTGVIVSVNTFGENFRVKIDNGREWSFKNDSVTEIKEIGMYLDEALKVVREDENMELSWGDKNYWCSFRAFLGKLGNVAYPGDNVFCVRAKTPAIKEVTMADLEEKYGCKVKVVK